LEESLIERLLNFNADIVKLQEFSVVRFYGDKSKADQVYKGAEPLTPDDIAEVVVFTAGRRDNVVIADTLIFPTCQVSWFNQ
jgi:3-hydroxy acid dehydrogenase / malonic semialdehyde reductase